ncbi:MAG: penicillin-binding transpeptidase domain-containing protein, partial [Oscillospiraceae bacterium]|jgi:penicillin-binding protein 2
MYRLIKPGRMVACALLLVVLVIIYVAALYKLQIVEGAAYYERSRNNIVTTQVVPAARGNILDRYGRLLVSNRTCNNVVVDTKELFEQEDPNAIILQMVDLVESFGDRHIDELPITTEPPFEYVDNMTAIQRTCLNAYLADKGMTEDTTAVELMAYFRERYDIDDSYDARQMRIIAGVRYELNLRYIIPTSDYIFAEDVSMDLVTTLLEQDIPGFEVQVSYVREYNTSYASHILGYIGMMDSEEYARYSKLGYKLNAQVGKAGVEKVLEEYLHGMDGMAKITSTASGTVTSTVYTEEPEPGNHVYLTIDIGLQEAAEQALSSYITQANEAIRQEYMEQGSFDLEEMENNLITGGSVVAIDVNSGEPLCIASYPGYNISTFLEDYESLVKDETKPLFNRALQGIYAPGSTFKMVTSIAALNEGIVTPETTIYDEGKFTKYEYAGYAPTCWIWGKGSHGDVNVTGALEVSCNYFFYTVGDYLGIDRLSEYAFRFGLGVHTGIELPEAVGVMSTQEYKKEVEGVDWYAGDTLQAAIGQSYNQFTPLQMANYVATVANGGTRYSASILKSVRSYDYSEKLYERRPEILDTIYTNEEYYEAVWAGMEAVANSNIGTAYAIFGNYPVKIAAKTGTAQMGEKVKNNAVFVCYAPAENPEIAISVVVEKGGSGSAIATIARDILDYYFSFKASAHYLETELSLLR